MQTGTDKILIIFGTRPEFIKLLPLFVKIKKRKINDRFHTVFTGQHSEFMTPLFHRFDFKPDVEIPYQDHENSIVKSFSTITLRLQETIDQIRSKDNIKCIVGQGDTTSCSAAAYVAFMNRIPFANVEAGLRTYDFVHPFPEEYNRRLITNSATIHFAPTAVAKQNLLNEGINESRISLTGNTVIDSIELFKNISVSGEILKCIDKNGKNVLITFHRRENQDEVLDNLIHAVSEIAFNNRTINFIWISHCNPVVKSKLSNSQFDKHPNISVIEPVDFTEILLTYRYIQLIITDSGGIQEEASFFGIPVIVCREKTERIESIEKGIAILQSSDLCELNRKVTDLLNNPVQPIKNLYGDGKAADRILDILLG